MCETFDEIWTVTQYEVTLGMIMVSWSDLKYYLLKIKTDLLWIQWHKVWGLPWISGQGWVIEGGIYWM